jgi:hypothetical protein
MYHIWRFLNNNWQYIGLATSQAPFTDMMAQESIGVLGGAASQWYVMAA